MAPALATPPPEPGTCGFEGDITTEAVQAALRDCEAIDAHTLEIRSPGGEVAAALQLARWVRQRGMRVVVSGECFSSCANYVFVAGREQIITAPGWVGWHGNVAHLQHLARLGLLQVPPGAAGELARLAAEEAAFYAELGVDGFLAWFGKLHPWAAQDIYLLSPESLRLFGLPAVQAPPDYAGSDLAPLNAGRPGRFVWLAPRADELSAARQGVARERAAAEAAAPSPARSPSPPPCPRCP
jgi:hypothetical protein